MPGESKCDGLRVRPYDIITIAKEHRARPHGSNSVGLFLCPDGGDTNGLSQGFLCGADLVHHPVQAPGTTAEGG